MDKIIVLFSHGNLAVEMLSNIVSTIQESANAISANTFLSRDKCIGCLPLPFTYSCQTICKTRDSFINWTCGKLSCETFYSKTVWASGEGFKIALCIASQTLDLNYIQTGRVTRWSVFLLKFLPTVLVEELLRDACNARRAPCILLNLPLRLAAVGCTL